MLGGDALIMIFVQEVGETKEIKMIAEEADYLMILTAVGRKWTSHF